MGISWAFQAHVLYSTHYVEGFQFEPRSPALPIPEKLPQIQQKSAGFVTWLPCMLSTTDSGFLPWATVRQLVESKFLDINRVPCVDRLPGEDKGPQPRSDNDGYDNISIIIHRQEHDHVRYPKLQHMESSTPQLVGEGWAGNCIVQRQLLESSCRWYH